MTRLAFVLTFFLPCLACSSAPERASPDERRAVESFENALPTPLPRLSAPLAEDELPTLLADLDSDNAERFSRAKARLRNGGEPVAIRLAASPFPESLRGRLTVIELVSLNPIARDKYPKEYAAYRDRLRDFVVTDSDGFEVHALAALCSLQDPADQALIAGLVKSLSRDVRWVAADYCLAARERITLDVLEDFIAMLGAADQDVRSDGMIFLARAWAILTPGTNPASRMPEFDVVADEDVRSKQLVAWTAWLSDVAPDLMKQ